LQNFPLLKRLKTLLMSNNLVFRIADDLQDSIPHLHTLMLQNNNLLNLNDLLPLANLANLNRLVLLDNNVTKQPNYRLFVIKHIPQLMSLDFKKIKPTVSPRAGRHRHHHQLHTLQGPWG
jgi:U2 small nuclear ribonucleoprotein A'